MVYEVRVDGRRCVARQSRRSPRALAWELDLLKFLHAAGMYVPRVVPASDGRRQIDGLVVLTWLEGEQPTSERDWWAVVTELERLHHLTAAWPQRPGFCGIQRLLTLERCGDVRLDQMPAAVVQRCRRAWQALVDEPVAAVHGDPGRANVRIAGAHVGFIDWDEARVDVPLLDLADLPLDLAGRLGPERVAAGKQAADAWEAANAWLLEPAYARRRLARLPL